MRRYGFGTRTHIAIVRGNLGRVLRALGDLPGARTQYERALQISETALGPDHPTIGNRRNNLGLVLRDLGDLTDAAPSTNGGSVSGMGACHPDDLPEGYHTADRG
jgi:hypothetical protein